jgi:[ribosomal protein S18]-alanine N-acetyltransferase
MITALIDSLRRVWRPAPSEVRPLLGQHAADAARLHAASFARGWDQPGIARMCADPAILADGLFRGRELIGFALSRIGADESELLTICLDPAERGQGRSHLLLQAHLAGLWRRGVAHVFLEVEDANQPAIALYRRRGFTQVGERQGYYPKADRARARALLMKADLN